MQEFFEWLNAIKDNGHLCKYGVDKIPEFTSKKSIMDVFLNAKGSGFLCEMERIGFPLPYSLILRCFHNYVNGKYISVQKAKNSIEYTSEVWCECSGEIFVGSTLVTLLGVKGFVYIEENSAVTLYVDRGCDIVISCPASSIVVCEYWGKKPRSAEDSIVTFVKR